MGCTSSSLNRRRRSFNSNSSNNSRRRRLSLSPRRSISVVGFVISRDYPLNVVGNESGEPLRPQFRRKHVLLDDIHTDDGDKTEPFLSLQSPNLAEDVICLQFESPQKKLSTLQERRLRCANLEVSALGLSGSSSEDDDDEDDGFEFAKLDDRLSSFDSDQGPIWTPIPSFNSEQGNKKQNALSIVAHGETSSILESHRVFRTDGVMSEPELEALASPDYADLTSESSPGFDTLSKQLPSQTSPYSPYIDNITMLQSQSSAENVSPCSSYIDRLQPNAKIQKSSTPMSSYSPYIDTFHSRAEDVSPCSSYIDRLRSNVDIQKSSTAEDHGFFPGFILHRSSECGSRSPSCASFCDSIAEYCPADDAYGDCQAFNKWNYQFSLWGNQSPSDMSYLPDQSESCHSYDDTDDVLGNPSLQSNPNDASDSLIPGLPNDLAQLCLMRVPFIKYNPAFRMVSKQWRAVLSSEEFFKARNALGIHEVHISFVVHGNRVQIFSLQSHQWFCLPPLPREDGSMSPGWRYSPEWDLAHRYSPDASSDWGIDPYDWWQIDTVAVSGGTMYVIGGDQAELQSFSKPSRPTNRVHKYDFCRNRWIPVSPMQVPRSHAAAVSLGKVVYVAGGSDDIDQGASAEIYNPAENKWTLIPRMNMSMRTCVGLEHNGCFYVKGESTRTGCHLEGEYFNPSQDRWSRTSPGMRRGLERGPIASCDSNLFVADWKDSVLKMYNPLNDSWLVVTELPARISRLVGHSKHLYGLTGKVKVDPYNHQVISDAPAEVWRLSISFSDLLEQQSDGENVSDQSNFNFRWQCLWWDPKQMVKTGALAWVPCIAHCTLFED